jgi:hypothetical protein
MGAIPVVMAAATAVSALGSIAQGRAASASAKYNARVAGNNAEIALQNAQLASAEGAANVEKESLKTRAQVGSIKAAQAANGIDVNKGSAAEVQQSAAELGKLDALTIRSNAARHAYGYQTEATSDRAQAALDRSQAKYDTAAGYVKGGSTLLSSAAMAGNSGAFDDWLNSTSMNGGAGTSALASSDSNDLLR